MDSLRRRVVAALTVVTVTVGAAETRGASLNWQVPLGNWSLSSNWTGGAAPTTTDSAFIQNGGTATVSQAGGTCGTLVVGSTSAAGTVQMSAGGLAVASYLYIGPNPGSSGRYDLGGSGQLSAPQEFVGYSGNGVFNQSGGTNTVTSFLYVGLSAASSGTYNLSGNGQLAADTEFIGYGVVGYGGNGVLNQSGGTNVVGENVYVNRGYYLLGRGLLQSSNSGTLHITNGGLQAAGGTLDCSGFPAITGGTAALLDLSSGVYNTSATTLSVAANSLLIVPSGFSPATYKAYSNLGLTATLGSTLNVSAGTGFGGWGTVPNRVACQGTIAATTGGWINLADGMALSGTGQVALGAGTLTVNDAGFSGMSGGILTASGMLVGSSGTANFVQSAGTNAIASLTLGGSATTSASYSLSGGLLRLSSLRQGSGVAVFNGSGGTLQAAASFLCNVPIVLTGGSCVFDTGGNTLSFASALSGSGKLIKSGTGVLVLSGTGAYSGGTTVYGGKLVITNPMEMKDGSDLTVGNGTLFHDAIVTGVEGAVAGENEVLVVPEPGTLLLTAAVLPLALFLRRRHDSVYLGRTKTRSSFSPAGSSLASTRR